MQAHNQLANPTHFFKIDFKPLKSEKCRADFEISCTVLKSDRPLNY